MYAYIYISKCIHQKNLKLLPPKTTKKKKQSLRPLRPHLHKDALLQGMCQKGAIDQHMVRLLVDPRWAKTKLTELEKQTMEKNTVRSFDVGEARIFENSRKTEFRPSWKVPTMNGISYSKKMVMFIDFPASYLWEKE